MAGFNFPATIRNAYADGVRVFVEVGPHCSCTRMIDDILHDKPHLAVNANHRGENEAMTLLKCLGTLHAAGLDIDLAPIVIPYNGCSACGPDWSNHHHSGGQRSNCVESTPFKSDSIR
jgi:acyl transferase domain-containing protein